MTHGESVLVGAAIMAVSVGLICGSLLEDQLSWVVKLGVIAIAMLVGAALGRVAFER